MKKWLIVVSALALVGVVVGLYLNNKGGDEITYRMAPVIRGDLTAMIGATGTVEPEDLVDVGAQVAGKVLAFGKDSDGNSVDYGSKVGEGTVLAQIDDSVYASDVAQATAQVAQAKAGVLRSQADLLQSKAKLAQAELDWNRAQKLGPSDALAKSSYDSYQAAYEVAKAAVTVSEAAVEEAVAAVGNSQAQLDKAKRNLSYCTIISPVKGVVIDRRVNIGQTVVASLNAPSLFLIAKDLRHMQVWVSVSEAYVGMIYPGQPVVFTVDAFGGETFTGTVGKVRLNATMTQNVVTYTVEVLTDNSSGRLLPYLTANVKFEITKHTNVLQVPNAALRWKPSQQVTVGKRQNAPSNSELNKPSGSSKRDVSTVWVMQDSGLQAVQVHVGITDDAMTEVSSDELKEGMEVVIGEEQKQQGQTGTKNPFAPAPFRGRR